jgi:surface antigen
MRLNSRRLAFAVLVVTLPAMLTACAGPNGKADSGLLVGAAAGGIVGNQIGRGKGNILATVAGAVVGGIVGSEIGRGLDQRDRDFAQKAELSALERGRTGQHPDNGRYGEVIPLEPYRRGSQDCRDYTHKVFIDGRPQAMRGTACRNPDGTWTNVS